MTQKHIACLLANDFEDSEFSVPVQALRDKGYTVTVVGAAEGTVLHGKGKKVQTTVDQSIDACSAVDYLGVLIPGGKSPSALCKDKRFVDFVRQFSASGKPIAAICHGPQLLIAAGVVRGRTLTAYSTVQDELRQAGAKVVDQAVACDKTWITSRTPDDIPQFVEAVVTQFDSNANQSWMARGDIHPHEPLHP